MKAGIIKIIIGILMFILFDGTSNALDYCICCTPILWGIGQIITAYGQKMRNKESNNDY